MAENKQFTPEKIDAMLKTASAKLGMSPEQLKATITDPKKAGSLLASLTGKKPAANNQQAIEELLNSNPKAKKLLNELLGEKDHG